MKEQETPNSSTLISRFSFPPDHPYSKWLVALSLLTGTLAAALSWTSLNLAIPRMMIDLRVDIDGIKWVLTASQITNTIMMPTVGWLGNRMGNKNLYLLSLFLFMVGSAFCGLSWNLESLVFFRILQSFGGGPMFPIAMTIMYSTFPQNQRGLALGIFTFSFTMGQAIGPTLGGYLVEHLSWRSVFYLNIPVGIVGLLFAAIFLSKEIDETKKPLDFWGFGAMTSFLITFLLAFSQGQKEGWDSSYIIMLMTISVVSLILFVAIEVMIKDPLVELRLFKNLGFTMSIVVSIMNNMSFMGSNFLLAIFIQNVLGYTPLQAGWLMLPPALIMGFTGIWSGRLSDQFDPKYLIAFGLAFMGLVWYRFSYLSPLEGTAFILFLLALQSFTRAWAMTPITTACLRTLPERDIRMGSGILSLIRSIGGTFGVAMSATIFLNRQAYHTIQLFRDEHLTSSATQQFLQSLQKTFLQGGDTLAIARMRSLSMVRNQLIREGSIAAYHDIFLLVAVMSMLAAAPALLIFQPKPTAQEKPVEERSVLERPPTTVRPQTAVRSRPAAPVAP
ncbi:MAG: DHA2 family efflux MFS transporter permease subunit [Candidatus Tectomicrobia bacterium]|nr:DHA2 family efflux MFS transporter permease subunit [Candidatus Tectomicrobia bacterium]